MQKIVLGAGCFWGVQHFFDHLEGVSKSLVGYSGGTKENPTYREVCNGTTGHAEVVWIEFDPEVLNFRNLIEAFFNCHNPTTLNRQGPDVGHQYRSCIYYFDQQQMIDAKEIVSKIDQSRKFQNPIVTEIIPFKNFFPAEEYHQKYFEKNGMSGCSL